MKPGELFVCATLNDQRSTLKKQIAFVDRPNFYFLLIDGSRDGPNFSFAEIVKYWDRCP